MTMSADAVIDPAMVRKINGYFSRVYLPSNTEKLLCDRVNEETLQYFFLTAISDRFDLSFHQNDNIGTFHETDRSLVRVISDGLISRLLPSFCILSDTSFFPTILFCRGRTG